MAGLGSRSARGRSVADRIRAAVERRSGLAAAVVAVAVAAVVPLWSLGLAAAVAVGSVVFLLSPVSTPALNKASEAAFDHVLRHRYAGLKTERLMVDTFGGSATFELLQKAVGLFIKDSVLSWYDEYSKDNELPQHVEAHLERAVMELGSRIFLIDRYKVGHEVADHFYLHIRNFNTARLAAGGSGASSFGPSSEALVAHFETLHEAAHPSLVSKEREAGYFYEVALALLKSALPSNEVDCELMAHMLSKMVVSTCFVPVLNLVTDPDYLYQLIVAILADPADPANLAAQPSAGDDDEDDDDDDEYLEAEQAFADEGAETASFRSAAGFATYDDVKGSGPGGRTTSESSDNGGEAVDLFSGFLQKSQPLSSVRTLGAALWRTRWFVLNKSALQFFTDSMKRNMKGEIPLHACIKVIKQASTAGNEFVFGLVCQDRSFFFAAGSDAERQKWVEHLGQLVRRVNNSILAKSLSLHDDSSIPKYSVSIKRFEKMLRHAEYLLAIKLERDGDESVATSWEISRRYREFLRLHRLLLARFGDKMRKIEFPTTLSTFSQKGLDSAHLETRKVHLDNYLQAILQHPEIGCSYEICQFLSTTSQSLFPTKRKQDSRGVVFRVANRVGRGFSEMAENVGSKLPFGRKKPPTTFVFIRKSRGQHQLEERGNPFQAYLEQLQLTEDDSRAGQERPRGLVSQQVAGPASGAAGRSGGAGEASTERRCTDRPAIPAAMPELIVSIMAEMAGHRRWLDGHPSAKLLLLKATRGALLSFYQKELDSLVTEEMWEYYVETVIEATWGLGPVPVRTPEMKAREQGEAFKMIGNLVPQELHRFCKGEGSQIEGAIMCFLSCLHFQRLNRHLFVGMFDILLCHVLNPGGGG